MTYRSPRLWTLLALLASSAALARGGGHYYYVTIQPGTSLTPRKDNICVAESVKVGDAGKNPNGDVMRIRSLSGKSPMCKNKDIPILAEVEFQASASFQSTLQVELPEGYEQKELTDKQRFDGFRMLACHKKKDACVEVQSWDRKHVAYFNRFVMENKHRTADGTENSTQTPTEDLTIHGAAAQRYETVAHPTSLLKPDWAYLTTMLLGDSEVVAVSAWARAKHYPELREELAGIAESMTGLVKEAPAPAAAAPAAAAGGAPPQGP